MFWAIHVKPICHQTQPSVDSVARKVFSCDSFHPNFCFLFSFEFCIILLFSRFFFQGLFAGEHIIRDVAAYLGKDFTEIGNNFQ